MSDVIFRNFILYFLVLYMRKQYATAKWNIAHPLDDVSLRRSLICKTFFCWGRRILFSPIFHQANIFGRFGKSPPPRKRRWDFKKVTPAAGEQGDGTSKMSPLTRASGNKTAKNSPPWLASAHEFQHGIFVHFEQFQGCIDLWILKNFACGGL